MECLYHNFYKRKTAKMYYYYYYTKIQFCSFCALCTSNKAPQTHTFQQQTRSNISIDMESRFWPNSSSIFTLLLALF